MSVLSISVINNSR